MVTQQKFFSSYKSRQRLVKSELVSVSGKTATNTFKKWIKEENNIRDAIVES